LRSLELWPSAVHICPNQTVAKVDQRTLRERGCVCSESVEHHLHTQVDNRQLDHLRVRDIEVGLYQGGHCHQGRRHRRLAGARVAVHRREFVLERIVEQSTPMDTQESKQLSHTIEALHQRLLLSPRPDHGVGSKSIPYG
jgi:hypothetical protein